MHTKKGEFLQKKSENSANVKVAKIRGTLNTKKNVKCLNDKNS